MTEDEYIKLEANMTMQEKIDQAVNDLRIITQSKDWVVVNYKNDPVVYECTRCKEKTPMPFNCKLDTVTNMGLGFAISHVFCEERL